MEDRGSKMEGGPSGRARTRFSLFHAPSFILPICALGSVLVLRACVAEPYRIPSDSMARTLRPGDHVLVEKLSFGARLPLVGRGPGLRGVRRGDVIVFEAPFPAPMRLLKRVVALPGDTVALVAGQVLVNGRAQPTPPEALVLWEDCRGDRVEATPMEARRQGQGGCALTPAHEPRATLSLGTFPDGVGNTATDVSPLRVPRRGDTLRLHLASWPRVRDVLRLEGHEARLLPGGTVLVDDVETVRYVVRDDYYYVLGDHRSASTDSRTWGFVPGRRIVGRAALIHYSADPVTGRPRWQRIGTPVL
jgi:signal peptidase I